MKRVEEVNANCRTNGSVVRREAGEAGRAPSHPTAGFEP